MVFRVAAIFCPHYRNNGQINARAAILPFIAAAVEIAVLNEIRMEVLQNVQGHAIGQRIAPAGGQIGIGPVVADAGHIEAGDNIFLHGLQIVAQVDNRADGFGDKNNAIGVSAVFQRCQPLGKKCKHCRTRQPLLASDGWQIWRRIFPFQFFQVKQLTVGQTAIG